MIPIIHARIHQKLIKHSKGNIVSHSFVKEWIARVVIKKGGIPRQDLQQTIKDLCEMKLLTRISRREYRIEKNTVLILREDIF